MTPSNNAWLLAAASVLVPGAAVAQVTSAERNDDIVVTAERSNRSLRDTATSVAVITGDDADRLAGTLSTYDLIERIPNLVATRQGNIAPAIRGVDGTGPAIAVNAFFGGTRPRINFMVDGRTLTFNEATYLDGGIWDLQQMEVYRGPQSTLQGRNAVAGVIAIKTADPTFQWSGRARALIGEDHTRQVSAAMGGPLLGDAIAFRLAADYRREHSFVDLNPYQELSHPERMKSMTLRGKLLIQPVSDFRSLLTVSYSDGYGPQTLTVVRPFKEKRIAAVRTPRFRTRATVGIADTSWQVTDGIGLSAFVTATDFRVNRYINVGNGIAQIDGREYTAEPRIRFGRTGDRLSGFIAAYLFDARQHEVIDLFGGGTFEDSTKTKAAFGELVWRPAERVDLTLGARYESEERDRTGGAGAFIIDFHRTFEAFLPRATLTVRPSSQLTLGATIGRGYNAGGAGFALNPPFPSFTYDKEMVWNYEGFARATLAGGRLRLSGNIFYNDYSGLQLPFDVAQNPVAPATVIRNAEKATTYGAEFEARFKAIEGLELFGSAGLLKTKVNRYADPSVQGRELPRSPAFSFNTGFVATPFAGFDVSFDVRYSDSYYSDVFNNARGKVDPYVLANGQIAYRTGPARFFIAANNLFNTTDPILYSIGRTFANDLASVTRSRRVTGGVELRF